MATITANPVSVDHVTYRTDVVGETTALLLQQFQGSENIVKLMSIIGAMKQILDTTIIQTAKLRLISTASGVYLDEIGEELGVPRGDMDDDNYRILLEIRGYKTKSQGTRPDIIDLITRMTGTDKSTIRTYVGYGKSVDLAFYEGCLNSDANAASQVEEVLPLVTAYRLVSLAGTPIGFKSVNDTTDPSGFLGFGSVFEENISWGVGGGKLGGLLAVAG